MQGKSWAFCRGFSEALHCCALMTRRVEQLWGRWGVKIASILAPKALRSTHKCLGHCNAPTTCDCIIVCTPLTDSPQVV